MAEAGVPEQTIRAIAGHVSQKMLERYAHPMVEAKRLAVQALTSPVLEQSSIRVPQVSPKVRPSETIQ